MVDGRTAVEWVAQKRVSDRGEVGSDLVAACVVRSQLDERARRHFCARQQLGSSGERAESLDLARVVADTNSSLVTRVVGDRGLDDRGRVYLSDATREIAFLDQSRSKTLAQ